MNRLNLATEKVTAAWQKEVLCAAPESPVREVMQLLRERQKGSAMICRDGRLIGIFTERDALRLMADGHDFDEPVRAVMFPDPATLSVHDSLATAISRMHYGGFRRLPIVDEDNRPIGLISLRLMLRYLAENFSKLVYTLPPAPHHTTHNREGA